MAIQSFGDTITRDFFYSGRVKKRAGWLGLQSVVKRKLDMIHYASVLGDLKAPPGNRLESLTGNLNGYHSIRVNQQWRIILRWTKLGPSDVSVVDYH